MLDSAQAEPVSEPAEKVVQCVKCAQSKGIGEFKADRRSTPRMPFVHPVRYCLGEGVVEDESLPGFVLDISLDGMGMCCQQGLTEGEQIWVRLPLSNGELSWLSGKIIYCEPDAEHYRAAVAFER